MDPVQCGKGNNLPLSADDCIYTAEHHVVLSELPTLPLSPTLCSPQRPYCADELMVTVHCQVFPEVGTQLRMQPASGNVVCGAFVVAWELGPQ